MAQALTIVIRGKDETSGATSSAKSNFSGLASGIKGVGVAAAGVAAAGIGALVAGVGALGVATFSATTDMNNSMRTLQSTLGATGEELDLLGDLAKEVFANNFGDSMDDAAKSLALVERSLGEVEGITDDNKVAMTGFAFAMEEAFGQDQQKTVDALGRLTKDFGLTAGDAMDTLAFGMQKVPADDLLETINEYGGIMRDAGFSAEEFMSILVTGAAEGVLGTDKMVDSIKEWGVFMGEGKDVSKDALRDIGMDWNALSADVSSGATTWADSFEEILQSVSSIEDPIKREQVQLALFGTMFEDLGRSATDGLSTVEVTMDDMTGSTEKLMARYDTFSNFLSTLWKGVVVDLGDMGNAIMRIVRDVLPDLGDEFFDLGTPIKAFTKFLGENATGIADFFQMGIETLAGRFADIKAGIQPVIDLFSDIWAALSPPKMGINPITGFMESFEIEPERVQKIRDFIDGIKQTFGELSSFFETSGLAGAISGIATAITGDQGVWENITAFVTPVADAFGKLTESLKPEFAELNSTLAAVWNDGLVPAIQNLGDSFPALNSASETSAGIFEKLGVHTGILLENMTPLGQTVIGGVTASMGLLTQFLEQSQPVITVWAQLFQMQLGEALRRVGNIMKEHVTPTFEIISGIFSEMGGEGGSINLVGAAVGLLHQTFAEASGKLAVAVEVFEFIASAIHAGALAIEAFIDAAGGLGPALSALSNINLGPLGGLLGGLGGLVGGLSGGGSQAIAAPASNAGGFGLSRAAGPSQFGNLRALPPSNQSQLDNITIEMDGETVGSLISSRQGKQLRHRNGSSIGGRAEL